MHYPSRVIVIITNSKPDTNFERLELWHFKTDPASVLYTRNAFDHLKNNMKIVEYALGIYYQSRIYILIDVGF